MATFFRADINGTILVVALELSWLVGEQVTASDNLLQLGEAAVKSANGARCEGSAAGKVGQSS